MRAFCTPSKDPSAQWLCPLTEPPPPSTPQDPIPGPQARLAAGALLGGARHRHSKQASAVAHFNQRAFLGGNFRESKHGHRRRRDSTQGGGFTRGDYGGRGAPQNHGTRKPSKKPTAQKWRAMVRSAWCPPAACAWGPGWWPSPRYRALVVLVHACSSRREGAGVASAVQWLQL